MLLSHSLWIDSRFWRRTQLGQVRSAGEHQLSHQCCAALLCKGWCKSKVQDCIRCWGLDYKSFLSAGLHSGQTVCLSCQYGQKCCNLIHISAKTNKPTKQQQQNPHHKIIIFLTRKQSLSIKRKGKPYKRLLRKAMFFMIILDLKLRWV